MLVAPTADPVENKTNPDPGPGFFYEHVRELAANTILVEGVDRNKYLLARSGEQPQKERVELGTGAKEPEAFRVRLHLNNIFGRDTGRFRLGQGERTKACWTHSEDE